MNALSTRRCWLANRSRIKSAGFMLGLICAACAFLWTMEQFQ